MMSKRFRTPLLGGGGGRESFGSECSTRFFFKSPATSPPLVISPQNTSTAHVCPSCTSKILVVRRGSWRAVDRTGGSSRGGGGGGALSTCPLYKTRLGVLLQQSNGISTLLPLEMGKNRPRRARYLQIGFREHREGGWRGGGISDVM